MATSAAIKLKPTSRSHSEPNHTALWNRVKALQDAYRTALLNRLYYGYRLNAIKKWNLALEITLAVGASSVAGAWALWRNTMTGEIVWATVAGLAALLAILKPISQLPKDIEKYSKLFTEHGAAFYDLEVLVGEVTRRQRFGSELEEAFQKIQERLRALCGDDDPRPSKKQVDRFCEEVNAKIPVDSLWRPLLNERSSHV
jgi:hypothetical protein